MAGWGQQEMGMVGMGCEVEMAGTGEQGEDNRDGTGDLDLGMTGSGTWG